jgi:menaquinone-dependent protoporphyrinogen oxidase
MCVIKSFENSGGDSMPKKALITYATWAGSTAEIAEGIAKVLRNPALDVEVWQVHDVKSLAGFDAVLLGTPIRMGHPHPDVKRFLKRFKKEIPNLKFAFFVACLNMSEDNQQNRIQTEGYLAPLFKVAPGIKPISMGLFAGVMDATKLKGFWKFVMSRTLQGDFRKWEKINAWAESLKPYL